MSGLVAESDVIKRQHEHRHKAVATKPGDELPSRRSDQTTWPRFTGFRAIEEVSLTGNPAMPDPTQIEDSP